MKKHLFILTVFVCCFFSLKSQEASSLFEDENIIYSYANSNPRSICSADVNGDGLQDVIVAFMGSNKVLLFENKGGGRFGEPVVLSSSVLFGATSVVAADFDNDGDIDIAAGSSYPKSTLAWFKNGGNGEFSEEKIVYDGFRYLMHIIAEDVNDDGFVDIVAVEMSGKKISWFANTGEGGFDNAKIIDDNLAYAGSVFCYDLDNDGDKDMVGASIRDTSNAVVWWANEGNAEFGERQIISNSVKEPRSIFVADMDKDGDGDLLVASSKDNKITMFRNESDGTVKFSEVLIDDDMPGAVFVLAHDMDMDNDLDVIGVSYQANKIVWYENLDGAGNLSGANIIATDVEGVNELCMSDLDNDTVPDLVVAVETGNRVSWFENKQKAVIGLSEQKIVKYSVYPNPAQDIISVDIGDEGAEKIIVVDATGRKFAEIKNPQAQTNIDISEASAGMYIVRVEFGDNSSVTKIIKL